MPFEPPKKTLHIHHKSMSFYMQQMRVDNKFSIAGFSDAEFYCMMGIRQGEKTGLGQIINEEHGKRLIDVLQRRQLQKNFLIAMPQCLWNLPHFADGQIDQFLYEHGIDLKNVYERDQITDDLARNADLFQLIDMLRYRRCCIIGPAPLRELNCFGHTHFVEISSPNLHLEKGGIERAVAEAKKYSVIYRTRMRSKKECVYLVSAGVSAAVIIDQLHDMGEIYAIDCGSIWDAFVGIGEQREWRQKLYANPTEWEQWKNDNLTGKL